MSKAHGRGPRCPFCPDRYFIDTLALHRHQVAKKHFPDRIVQTDDEIQLEKMRAYHAEKSGAQS